MFRKVWRVVYPAFLLIVVYLAVYLASMLIYDAFFRSQFPDFESFIYKWGDAVSIAALLLGGIAAFLFYRSDYVFPSDRIYKKPVLFIPVILIGILASHGLSILVSLISSAGFLGRYDQTEQLLTTSGVILTLVKTVILVPFAEEITFRGLVFRRMKEYSSFIPAALISSLLFAIYHMNLLQGIFAFLYGILLCMIYNEFQNLWPCIAMHGAANLAAVLIQVSGIDYPSVWIYVAVMVITLAASALIYLRFINREIFKKSVQK